MSSLTAPQQHGEIEKIGHLNDNMPMANPGVGTNSLWLDHLNGINDFFLFFSKRFKELNPHIFPEKCEKNGDEKGDAE